MSAGVDRSALMHTYAEPPVTFVRGAGTRAVGHRGPPVPRLPVRAWRSPSLGHAHPAVAEALAEQARTLLHVSNLFGNAVAPEVAVDHRPARSAAGRRAPAARSSSPTRAPRPTSARSSWPGGGPGPGRHVVVSTWDAFHGRTLATLHATGQPAKHAPFEPLPEGFDHVALRRPRRAGRGLRPDRASAAVLVEPIQGEAGVIAPSSDYLGGVRELCTERGILLMVDEVQTGLGRTGRWFAFQHAGHRARRRHHGQGARQRRAHRGVLGPGRGGRRLRARATTARTFGGQPLAAAAARATLAVMEARGRLRPGRAGRGPAGGRARARSPA